MGILVILYIRMGLRIRQTSEIQRNLPRMQQQHHNGPTMPQTGLVQQVPSNRPCLVLIWCPEFKLRYRATVQNCKNLC